MIDRGDMLMLAAAILASTDPCWVPGQVHVDMALELREAARDAFQRQDEWVGARRSQDYADTGDIPF